MRKTFVAALSSVAVAGLCWIVLAGELAPPGPPGPTMLTLQDIYDKLQRLEIGPILVQKSGQTVCSDEIGEPIDCAGTGHDGEYQTGIAVDPRFTDRGDGTVRDNITGLIWLKNANCFDLVNWMEALSDANTLADGACGLTDGSLPGDWRLPNVREAMTLIDYGHAIPALPDGHPFSNVPTTPPFEPTPPFWSSSSVGRLPGFEVGHAWRVHYDGGYVALDPKTDLRYAWPVRGGL